MWLYSEDLNTGRNNCSPILRNFSQQLIFKSVKNPRHMILFFSLPNVL